MRPIIAMEREEVIDLAPSQKE